MNIAFTPAVWGTAFRSRSAHPSETATDMLPHDLDPVGLLVALAVVLAYRRARHR